MTNAARWCPSHPLPTVSIASAANTVVSKRVFGKRATNETELAFVNRKEAIVECESQQRQAGADRWTKLTLEAAVGVLSRLELPNEQRVPFFPSLHIALEQGLGLVISGVFLPSTLIGGVFELLREVAQRGLVLWQVLAAGDGIDERGDRDAGRGFIETAETTGIADLAGTGGHLDVIVDGLIDRFVGNLDAGVASGEQADEDCAAHRCIGVSGIGRIAPGAEAVLLLRGDGRPHGELQRLADCAAFRFARPEITIVDRAIGLSQAEHRKAVMVHAVAHDAGAGVLLRDDVFHRPADVARVQAEIWI